MNFLQGKKTYIVAACAILYAVFGYISGYLDFKTATDVIFAAFAVMGIRNGITTEIQSVLAATNNSGIQKNPSQSQ